MLGANFLPLLLLMQAVAVVGYTSTYRHTLHTEASRRESLYIVPALLPAFIGLIWIFVLYDYTVQFGLRQALVWTWSMPVVALVVCAMGHLLARWRLAKITGKGRK